MQEKPPQGLEGVFRQPPQGAEPQGGLGGGAEARRRRGLPLRRREGSREAGGRADRERPTGGSSDRLARPPDGTATGTRHRAGQGTTRRAQTRPKLNKKSVLWQSRSDCTKPIFCLALAGSRAVAVGPHQGQGGAGHGRAEGREGRGGARPKPARGRAARSETGAPGRRFFLREDSRSLAMLGIAPSCLRYCLDTNKA